jgi:hypothetical protein
MTSIGCFDKRDIVDLPHNEKLINVKFFIEIFLDNLYKMCLYSQVRDAVGFASDSDGSEGLRSGAVWSDLKRATLPFLRCAALFYHHLVKKRNVCAY